MKYIDEYRDKALVKKLISEIQKISRTPVKFMEVCGGHTMAIHKFGIRSLLPDNIKLVSGPGCPVCVSDIRYIDKAIAYSKKDNIIIATFGDLIRVPGSNSSLDKEKASGADIRIVYSPLDAVEMAKNNPDKQIVFLGIGFETTAPGTASAILHAKQENLSNFLVLSSHKVMPPAMQALIDDNVQINGYIAPGHVSTITGSNIYNFIVEKYNIPVVVTGFEPTDMLHAILMLVNQVELNNPQVEIQYKRAVKQEGNIKAQKILATVFELSDEWWRGLGTLPKSGLKIRQEFEAFDAEKQIQILIDEPKEPKGCICGEILKGIKEPADCKLFSKVCKPESPVGACMVSNEGSCHAAFKYRSFKV